MISTVKIDEVIALADVANANKGADHMTTYGSLYNYLEALTFDEVKSLQTVMYVGRDFEADDAPASVIYQDMFSALSWNTKEIEINQIVQKVPLANYLRAGKKILSL